MKKISILGAGLVGSAMVRDLADRYKVNVIDFNPMALGKLSSLDSVEVHTADIAMTSEWRHLAADSDLIIGSVPGHMGLQMLKDAIPLGKPIVDISFCPEDPSVLDDLAKEHGIPVVVDCGVAPGMSNMILGRYYDEMEVTDYRCLVGGLPRIRKWPFEYKAPFSPSDVIEEYVRPARFRKNGHDVTREALSDIELHEFEEIGTLESFNSDGLRSLIQTMPVPNMIEKTLRYPGHADMMKVFRESGFFDDQKMDFRGGKISPLEMTSKLLFKSWELKDQDEEFTAMQVEVKGKKDGQVTEIIYNLLDRRDPETGISSMARTTGYTCTAVADLILSKELNMKGVIPPEEIARDRERFEFVLAYLQERGVFYSIKD